MSEQQIGFVYRLIEFIQATSDNEVSRNENSLREAESLKEQLLPIFISTTEKCNALPLATDILNYAIMRLSFIECEIPLTSKTKECNAPFFRQIVAAALVYRNVIHKHLRLHAPTRVDRKLFDDMMVDMILNALLKVPGDHRHLVACACIVSAAHFFFQRGIEEYVGLSRNLLAKFMEGDFFKDASKMFLRSNRSFDDVDIGLLRNAVMAKYGAGNLQTYYDED